jgi:hypothetical protein
MLEIGSIAAASTNAANGFIDSPVGWNPFDWLPAKHRTP